MRAVDRAPFALLVASLVACGGGNDGRTAPPREAHAPLPPAPPRSPAPSPELTILSPDKLPTSASVDGDLAEWAGHGAPSGSWLSFALTSEGAFVAAELGAIGPLGKDGVWLYVSFPAPPGAAMDAARASRFERVFRIDRQGVRLLGEESRLEAVEGAASAFVEGKGGRAIEARLPVAAYPRASSAPIVEVSVYAIAATDASPPPAPRERFTRLGTPGPVHFEPHGALRAAVCASIAKRKTPAGFSYHPATPERFELAAESPSERTLYTRLDALGDVEIGLVPLARTHVAVLSSGALTDLAPLGGELVGIAQRNGELHVFAHEEAAIEGDLVAARWSVLSVDEDGSTANPINVETGVGAWTDVYEFHNEKLTWFGLRGIPSGLAAEETPRPIEIAWHFDPVFGVYMPRTREIAELLPKSQRKKRK